MQFRKVRARTNDASTKNPRVKYYHVRFPVSRQTITIRTFCSRKSRLKRQTLVRFAAVRFRIRSDFPYTRRCRRTIAQRKTFAARGSVICRRWCSRANGFGRYPSWSPVTPAPLKQSDRCFRTSEPVATATRWLGTYTEAKTSIV